MAQNQTIPSGWEKTNIGQELFPVSDTFSFRGKDRVHFLNTGDILDGKLLHSNSSDVCGLPGQAKKSFKKGDILYSEIRPENKRYMLVDFDASNSVASTKLMVLRTRSTIDKKFAYQMITARETVKEFQSRAESRSGTFPQITFDAISDFEIYLPPLAEQKEIAGVLGALDDKIELLREQNKTLEGVAQELFKQWFVRFEFPDSNGRPYRSSGGKMIPSELGEIPEGWRIRKLGDVIDLDYGKALKAENRIPGDILVYGSMGCTGSHNESLVKGPGIVVGRKGNPGTVTLVFEDFFVIDTAFYVSLRDQVRSWYFIFFALLELNLKLMGTDSAVPGLNRNIAYMSPLIIPLPAVEDDFDLLMRPMFDRVFQNTKEINNLESIRNSLLPKLMDGSLRVK